MPGGRHPEGHPEELAQADPDYPVRLTSGLTDRTAAVSLPEPTLPSLDYGAAELTRLPPIDDVDTDMSGNIACQWAQIRSDHTEFYSVAGLKWLTLGLGAGAIMANTRLDESFLHDTYTENVVLAPTHEFYERLHQPKILGNGWYLIPAFAGAAFSRPILDDLPFGQMAAEWGQRSLRTILVGAPPMLALQVLTGGSRPGESSAESKWRPLEDNNGVSGHSFMGAVPFLSAAKMSDNPWLKAGLYSASALPALSRINDDDHYPSQTFLGWWLAYLAASAVDRSQMGNAVSHAQLVPQPGGVGVEIDY